MHDLSGQVLTTKNAKMSPEELDALLAAPALAPPPGVTPNFDNPSRHNDYAWGITTVCMVVATLCLFLRWYVRIWLDRRVRMEDGTLNHLPKKRG